MRNVIILLLIFTGAVSFAQEKIPNVLSLAVKKEKPFSQELKVNIDFSFYSKNFENVLGYYKYTSDNFDYGTRNVYVGYNDSFYYDNNRPIILGMPGAGVDLNNMAYYNNKLCIEQSFNSLIKK